MTLPLHLQEKLQSEVWQKFPSLCVIDEILKDHPEIIEMVREDVEKGLKNNNMGRGDSPSAEYVLRCGIYKELRGVSYRELALHLEDSKICELFTQTGLADKALEKSALQDYISKIRETSLQRVIQAINKVAINWEIEDLSSVRSDTTVVSTNIHYPTNASLVWDSIKSSVRLLKRIDKRLRRAIKKKTTN